MPDCSGQIHILILELRVKSAQPKTLGLTHVTAQWEGWCPTFISVTVVKKYPNKDQLRGKQAYFCFQFWVRITSEKSQQRDLGQLVTLHLQKQREISAFDLAVS